MISEKKFKLGLDKLNTVYYIYIVSKIEWEHQKENNGKKKR